jgi:heat shock protein HslJ/uncharacterized membrane protein
MKKITFLGLFLCFAIGCKTVTPKQTVVQEDKSESAIFVDEMSYFKANGNEPFWDLDISEKEIVFKSLVPGFEIFKAPHSAPIQAMDANVKLYRLETESVKMNIQITQEETTDSMAGKIYPYSVMVEIKRGTDQEFKIFKGQGQYITDHRLYDIWVLEQINGKKASISDYNANLPRLEMNTTKNQFYGFAGCNHMTGSLFFEKGLLRFTNVASTLMACGDNNKESDFLKALQSTTSYSIGSMRLSLSNPSGVLLVFRKVD